tara:strand:- start:2496 stop:3164 length:669 start_codon:yes stop_codon:yes gene_type:complete
MFRQFLPAEPIVAQHKTTSASNFLERIQNIPKPKNAWKYYLENWKTPAVLAHFEALAVLDKERHAAAVKAVEAEEAIELIKRKIYTRSYVDGVGSSGLDNGFSEYVVRGPIVKIVYFTEKELEKLEADGLKIEDSDGKLLYKELFYRDGAKCSYNKTRSKRYNAISYGGRTIMEGYEGYVGKYTRYESTFGKVWYSPLEADQRSPDDPDYRKTFGELHQHIK